MLRRENIHDCNGLSRKVLERRGQRASARENFTFTLGISAFANGAYFAPKHVSVSDGRFLKWCELGAGEIGFNIVIFHPRQKHLACCASVERCTHAKIRHSPHWVEPFDEVDVDAEVAGLDGKDDSFVHLVADVPHHRNGNVMDVDLPPPDIGQADQFKSKTILPTLGIEFAKIALDQTTEETKHRGLWEIHRLHDFR